MMFAQAAAEYGATSAIASAVESLVYRFEYALGDRGVTAFLAIGAGALVWWLFFRSK